MKQIFFLMVMAFAFSAATCAQEVQKDTAASASYMLINTVALPAYMQYGTGITTMTRLYMKPLDGDFSNEAGFIFELRGLDPNGAYSVIKRGVFRMTDSVYTSWDRNDATHPFILLAASLGVTISE
jgi:hypothetical protein